MKKGTTLLMALGLMMATTISANAEIVNDYVVDFNEPISTSAHNFKVAEGWGHIVDYFSSVDRYDDPYDYYVKYSYSAENGLYADNQKVGPDWSMSLQQDVYDLLVTPTISGTVTLSVKQSNYNGYVEFYTINDNAKGELIGKQHKSDLSTDGYTDITITVNEPAKIGIRASRVYINNFTASQADIQPNKLMTVVSAVSHCSTTDGVDSENGVIYWAEDPTHKTADGKNMVKICYMVKVKNACNVTLTEGEPNYSVSIVNSKSAEPLVTVAVPQTLAPDETSEAFEVTAYVDPSKFWSYAGATSERFNVRENLDGTMIQRPSSGYKQYVHAYIFRNLNSFTTSKFSSPISFGIISEESTQNFEIFNNGVAPLTVTSISVDAPFTVAYSEPLTINAQEKITVAVTFPATAKGPQNGNLTITYIDNDGSDKTETYTVNGTMLDANTWSTDFGAGKSSAITWPEGSVAEGSVSGDYTYVGGDNPYNTYVKSSNSTTGNKFFTPLLHANAGDSMSFMLKPWSTSHYIKVYVTTDRTNLGEPVLTADNLTSGVWTMETITIEEEGDYYVAFELNNGCLDDIVGLTKVDVAHDLYIKDLGSYSSTSYQSGETISKEINIIPVLAAKAEDYTVEFILGDEVAAVVESRDLTANAKTATRFSASATKTVTSTTEIDYYWRFTFKNGGPVFESEHVTLTIICEPKFCFVTKGTSDNKYNAPSNKTSHNFGKVNESNITAEYEIFNWGQGSLTINSISVPEGFTTTFTAPVTLEAKGRAEVPVTFSATELGSYSGNIVINYLDADGENKDFEFAVSGTMLDSTKFYASFDNGTTDCAWPAGSVRDSSISSGNAGSYAAPNNYITSSSSTNNLFITPLLHAEAGESFNFDARIYSTSWSEGTVKVYAASTRADLRNEETRTALTVVKGKDVEDQANLMTVDYKTFTATIAEAGDYYIGYEISGRAYLDEIYGLSPVAVAHDIELAGFSAPETAMQNNVTSATVQLRNFGKAAEAAGSYSAIVSVNGVATEVTDLPEIPVMFKSNDTPVSINVPFRYGKVGTFPVSVKLQFGDFTIETETADVEFTEEVLSAEKQVGEFKELSTVPFMTNYKNVETVALYTPDQLGLNGGDVINTITLRGYFNVAHTSEVVIAYAWVDETTLDKPAANSKYDTSDMTVVFSDPAFNWPGGGNRNEITDLFTLDMNGEVYTEGKSLLMMFGGYADSYKSAAYTELSTWTTNCYYRQNDGTKGNMIGSWGNKNLPVLHIALAVEPKTISGTVTGPDDQPVAGATVTLTDATGAAVEYTGTTAADGTYEINVIQANRTYNVIVVADGLEDYANGVTFEESVVMNFKVDTPAVHINPEANGIESAENASIRFNLGLTPGYHALALPFAIDHEKVAAIFGTDAEIFTLAGTTLEDGVLFTFFETANALEAGEPFLVKVTETHDVVIKGVTLVAEPIVGGAASKHVTFSASYQPTSGEGKFTFSDADFVILPDEEEVAPARYARAYAPAADIVPAFHATLQARPNQQIDSMNFAVNQTPTSIKEITVKYPEGKVYDLRGVRSLNPSKGIYIINGKKVLVK